MARGGTFRRAMACAEQSLWPHREAVERQPAGGTNTQALDRVWQGRQAFDLRVDGKQHILKLEEREGVPVGDCTGL